MRTFAEKPKTTQQTTSAKSTIPCRAHFGQSREVNSIVHLQRTIENQAVQRMLQTDAEEAEAELTGTASPRFGHDFSRIPIHPPAAAIQEKLAINKPGDEYEQETDRVSEQMMRTPEPQLHQACPCGGACPKCQTEQLDHGHERLHAKRGAVPVSRLGDPLELDADAVPAHLYAGMSEAGGGSRADRSQRVDAVQSVGESGRVDASHDLKGAQVSSALASLPQTDSALASRLARRYGEGQPLAEGIRHAAEPLLGYDLGAVRVHPYEASEIAEAVAARAFAVGRHIYFGHGEYNLGTRDGMSVLLHELAHTVQPSGDFIRRWPRITSWDFRHSDGESKSQDNCAPLLVGKTFPLGVDNKVYGPNTFTNGMELRAHIADHKAGYRYDIKRMMEWTGWERIGGIWSLGYHQPPTLDDPDNLDECLVPSPPPDQYIYSADAPGLTDTSLADPGATDIVLKHTFAEWVDMERTIGVGVEGTNTFLWHSIIWLTKGTTWEIDKTRSEIAAGAIKVDTATP